MTIEQDLAAEKLIDIYNSNYQNNDRERELRIGAIRGLGDVGGESAVKKLKDIYNSNYSSNEYEKEMRTTALEALGKAGRPRG